MTRYQSLVTQRNGLWIELASNLRCGQQLKSRECEGCVGSKVRTYHLIILFIFKASRHSFFLQRDDKGSNCLHEWGRNIEHERALVLEIYFDRASGGILEDGESNGVGLYQWLMCTHETVEETALNRQTPGQVGMEIGCGTEGHLWSEPIMREASLKGRSREIELIPRHLWAKQALNEIKLDG